jgi:type I restriction enzyme M protein
LLTLEARLVGQFAKLPYQDEAGFSKSATLAEIAAHDYVLTPGRYVGAADVEDGDELFEEKMERLRATLNRQFAESAHCNKRNSKIFQ